MESVWHLSFQEKCLKRSWNGNLDSWIGNCPRLVIWRSEVRMPVHVQAFLLKSKLLFYIATYHYLFKFLTMLGRCRYHALVENPSPSGDATNTALWSHGGTGTCILMFISMPGLRNIELELSIPWHDCFSSWRERIRSIRLTELWGKLARLNTCYKASVVLFSWGHTTCLISDVPPASANKNCFTAQASSSFCVPAHGAIQVSPASCEYKIIPQIPPHTRKLKLDYIFLTDLNKCKN